MSVSLERHLLSVRYISTPPACVIFLIYLVFEEINFHAGAAFMGQVIGDDQMIHFKVRD